MECVTYNIVGQECPTHMVNAHRRSSAIILSSNSRAFTVRFAPRLRPPSLRASDMAEAIS